MTFRGQEPGNIPSSGARQGMGCRGMDNVGAWDCLGDGTCRMLKKMVLIMSACTPFREQRRPFRTISPDSGRSHDESASLPPTPHRPRMCVLGGVPCHIPARV